MFGISTLSLDCRLVVQQIITLKGLKNFSLLSKMIFVSFSIVFSQLCWIFVLWLCVFGLPLLCPNLSLPLVDRNQAIVRIREGYFTQ